jgi:multimeric flavodoxin WrbA
MCGQMKTLIDRTCSRYTEINNKDFYFIMTAADTSKQSMKRTLEEFRGFTSCLNHPTEKEIIYGTGAWNKGEINGMPAMNEAFQIGNSI